jgi:hypothetical protein
MFKYVFQSNDIWGTVGLDQNPLYIPFRENDTFTGYFGAHFLAKET